ncbi:hypothetical protein CKAH01_17412 [Colletotrichum kahawae]|uniref:Uncharacterized protein n=1 Tax=Colletotrichum kahawae TaxID=34407 RepID=A0AAE0D3N4_COLKA|nr:hypothetical protein CKAH01_17412 [Colletotrichum kahawae]
MTGDGPSHGAPLLVERYRAAAAAAHWLSPLTGSLQGFESPSGTMPNGTPKTTAESNWRSQTLRGTFKEDNFALIPLSSTNEHKNSHSKNEETSDQNTQQPMEVDGRLLQRITDAFCEEALEPSSGMLLNEEGPWSAQPHNIVLYLRNSLLLGSERWGTRLTADCGLWLNGMWSKQAYAVVAEGLSSFTSQPRSRPQLSTPRQ